MPRTVTEVQHIESNWQSKAFMNLGDAGFYGFFTEIYDHDKHVVIMKKKESIVTFVFSNLMAKNEYFGDTEKTSWLNGYEVMFESEV